ncbi:MAG: ABC transporter permease [Oscillospiraceae bacterium]|jgi:oligopeptide transport system permease protein|nr:ABC transporter permease [Oscillospiraceae bacterium]
MVKYICKRVLAAVITMLGISVITFALMKFVPGGPFLAEKAPSAAVTAALEAKYGLDKHPVEQYFTYMKGVLRGDLGPSIKKRGRTVAEIIAAGFPVSAKLGAIAIAVAVLLGVPLGSIAALCRGKWQDNLILVAATTGISVPSFITASLLLVTFGVKNNVTFGLATPAHYIIPVAALAFLPMSYIARLIRSSMLDVMGQDYMRTAKAKGLSQAVILFKHALRNSVLPVITYLGPAVAYTLTGSFVVERICTIPGLGNEFVSSIINRDYPMIMGTTLFLAALIIVMNVAVDIVYRLVDPRITFK